MLPIHLIVKQHYKELILESWYISIMNETKGFFLIHLKNSCCYFYQKLVFENTVLVNRHTSQRIGKKMGPFLNYLL